jgi:hypothetical protein
VRRAVRRGIELAIVPMLGLVLALVIAPGRAALSFHVWLLVMLALTLIVLIRALRASVPTGPSLFEIPSNGTGGRAERFASLARLERSVSMATASGYDVHHRLRPAVREIASGLLLVRRGIDLDRQPEVARAVLGEPTWELVRAERERPQARREPGLDVTEIEMVVAALESV